MSLTPHSHHRTRVTRADAHYPLGQQAPAVRVEAGEVLSVEDDGDDTTCTVEMFGETVDGVVVLADPPAVGDIVEVWEADDLLWTPGYTDLTAALTQDYLLTTDVAGVPDFVWDTDLNPVYTTAPED